MYIFKYAWLNLKASFGKNLLVGIIVMVIAFASCVSLSIREAADNTRESEMEDLSVTANIRIDRNYEMKQMSSSKFDREEAAEMLKGLRGLTLDEYTVYSEAKAVDDFYYSETVYLNSDDDMQPIDNNEEEEVPQMQMGGPGMMGMPVPEMQKTGDFTVIGYSCDEAMEDFQDGIKQIKTGKVFAENTKKYQCLISENLALYNSLKKGDKIKLVRPDDEDVTVQLTIVGTFSTQTDAEYNTTQEDPDNEILVSAKALKKIVKKLNENVPEEDEEDMLIETVVTGIYSFETAEDYYAFEKQAVKLGLEEKYTIVSNDIALYEASLLPLDNLKNYAMILLVIVLVVGVTVLIFLNIINVNSRKKEIGTLASMGMSRFKVASQYIIEIFVVMILFVSIGTVAGAMTSGPVTNQLLSSQVAMQEAQTLRTEQNFGRPQTQMQNTGSKPVGGDVEGKVEYVTEINYTTDYQVILQLIAITVALAMISSVTSIIYLLQIEPVKILSSSD